MAVDAHGARRHVVQAGEERDEGRLAGTRRSHERDGFASGDGEREPPQHIDVRVGVAAESGVLFHRCNCRVGSGRVAEDDVVELDRAPRIDEVDCTRPLLDCFGCVEHLEHPLEADHRRHQIDAGVREPGERLVHACHQRSECDERADQDRAVDHHERAEAVHRGRAEGADQSESHEEHSPQHR